MPAHVGFRRLAAAAMPYLLNDAFLTEFAAGSVNGTGAVPGPGVRAVVDAESKLSVSGGALQIAGGKAAPAWGDPQIIIGPVQTRVAGRITKWTAQVAATTTYCFFGQVATNGLALEGCWFVTGGLIKAAWDAATLAASSLYPAVGSYAASTEYKLAVVARSAGNFLFVSGGAFSTWTLLWVISAGTNTIRPCFGNYNAAVVADNVALPAATWLPVPLAADTFTRAAIGSTDGLAGDAVGGGGLTWASNVGTVGISGNAAIASAVAGGIAIATVDTGQVNVLHSAAITKTTTAAGVVVRYKDAANYIYAVYSGTNAQLYKRVADSETKLIDAAATYAAGALLTIDASGTAVRLYYNNALVGAQQTIADADLQTGTACGLYFGDTDSTADDVLTYAKTSATYDSILGAI